ncbi:hypothetical protein VF04_03985 [Nostoc linckia z7]|uniref:Uncharacterized protein n=3 Tax=Nostoc linckia TaxID=92942 RepID=A0A9Q6ENC5_NOSLI|nr:hypothetical protein VF02_11470 [Nostoc linckia z1]PHJ70132.1 hypothetical protein VF05_11630 [Nostoc linckia z3]PHJ75033.1 hypothetical protein VF03_11790 [Nostoc linckia z2]PHJ82921.1 hypothetical protein VF06_14290 [Nostoc linckia z4]PHJ89018.1 hypothetical protein VF07_13485 [Nostoc linckia z6]PHK00077.1 hypothetical protein VF04_03985 [Nostoc linckia z7]PHK06740.1 hypothetical protein VF08_03115 [Nostoc linckia z8]PHK23257.1 hypothetical protein VF11_02810 [Nostoc linckia z14]PHK269
MGCWSIPLLRTTKLRGNMDFSILTDDQLLQLLKGAMAEAIKRGGAVRAAAQGEVLSSQERAAIEFAVAEKLRIEKQEEERKRIAKEAEAQLRQQDIEKQVEKTENQWSIKSAAVAAIRQWGYEGDFDINIWSRGADRRIYFQDAGRRWTWKWCLYVTGNQYHAPGELEGEGNRCWFDDKQDQLKAFLEAIAESWKGDISIPCRTGNVEPSPRHLAMYLKAIGIAQEVKA